MRKINKKKLIIGTTFLTLFIIWTIAIKLIDIQSIGPKNSEVGLGTINNFFHNLIGVNFTLYNITDWLGLIPIFFIFGFAVLGLFQWIKRKSIKKVDFNLIILGIFYIIVLIIYFVFEILAINYRPVLINNILEASYPSSTTMLVLCVIPTAILQFNTLIKNKKTRLFVNILLYIFIAFMILGRIISGVHWITDIIGGILFSSGIVLFYDAITHKQNNTNKKS